ncbi:MAG: hypothetical protein A2V62_08710 [Nitrospirae bacterium RBG_19FT_COMBO_58_9]|nr:MAG: hypothetical protein A2V62_08710 [Nitrospirae bacterium RBG_19FT_COMBO_58_9]
MTNTPPPKALTHDEKKAADAAFAGRPFNESWSAAARTVYDGIVKALPQREVASLAPSNIEEPTEALPAQSEPVHPQEPLAQTDTVEHELVEGTVLPPAIRDREAAIQAGTLIDVTPTAQQLGITFPVTITRPLWEVGIVTSQSLPEQEQTNRLRDILMAFRLRLASLTTVSPLLDFPVLLALPPSQVPQPVPLFALIQPDPTHQANVTLLLPNEVSLSITSLN